ncbi:GNAT family N-acetyltransferase [Vibrio panuliri]|uniref:GNAT family N-acetyltransferase n=1 Tax=Vibrio panuliri TaxID=1381081 RepID=A0ABX3FJN6_9VIBR|nr:GNAT family N-acetyltransferase [Vibrio panuliri]KAB1454673.1 GNAT family N-acetyltransferase [Vibrio panuliri]OLQ94135.1 GNAT family N-acetyltransferase [Vibrio panuliri]
MLETKRLILRQWEDDDYPHFAKMCADPEVMKYFPATLSEQESHQLADRLRALIDVNGWGFWVVELKATGEFIGFVGLNALDGESGIPGAPMIEIGWRTVKKHWRKGYATEAAEQALRYAFFVLGVEQVYAFTPITNTPSQMVMKRLGMVNARLDFDHPKVDVGHELRRHCLYKIDKQIVTVGSLLGSVL